MSTKQSSNLNRLLRLLTKVASAAECQQSLARLRDGDAVIRLVDDVIIEGTLLDLEGQPVAGAKLQVSNIRAFPSAAK